MWKISFLPSRMYSDVKEDEKPLRKSFSEIRLEFEVNEIRLIIDQQRYKQALLIKFVNFFVTVQFRHIEHYLYFKKLLKVIIKITQPAKRSVRIKSESRRDHSLVNLPKFQRRKMCVVDPSTKLKAEKSPVSSISESVIQSASTSSQYLFHDKRADNWTLSDIHCWLECLFVPTLNGPMTICEYLKAQRLLRNLDNFFQNQREIRNYSHLEEELLHQTAEKCDPLILPIYRNRHLRNRILQGIKNLNSTGGYFSPCYSMVLKKRLLKKLKQKIEDQQLLKKKDQKNHLLKRNNNNNTMIHLREVENELHFKRRYWWDIEECKNHILSLLIFHKDFSSLIRNLEKEFREFELISIRSREEEKKKEEVEGEEEEEEEVETTTTAEERKNRLLLSKGYPSLSEEEMCNLDPELWRRILVKFNEKNGNIKLEQISFKIHIANQQNKLRFSKQKIEKELNKKKESLKKLKDEKIRKEIKLESIERHMNLFISMIEPSSSSSSSDGDENNNNISKEGIERVLKNIETQKKILKMCQQQYIKIKEKIISHETLINNLQNNIRLEIAPAICSCTPDQKIEKRDGFMKSMNRQAYISSMLKSSMKNKVRPKKMGEFVVKLVLSYRKSDDINTWQSMLMSKLGDPLFKPSFFRWGFLHANLLIAGVGVHWFANSICYLSDLSLGDEYEEICAIDCFCPLMVDIDTIDKKITDLAEEIVFSNVNYEYSTFQINLLKKKDKLKLNCQEFVYRLMNILDSTPFFPIVQKYLDQLKSTAIHVSKKNQIKNSIRWIPVSNNPKLLNFLKPLLSSSSSSSSPSSSSSKKKKKKKIIINIINGKIFFKRHSEVDQFYHECAKLDNKFGIKFPGVMQLLKSFCRAFRMLYNLYPDNSRSYAPLEISGCPFRSFDRGGQQ